MTETPGEPSLEELETLRSGLRIMAVRALGDPEDAKEAAQESLARAVAALSGGRGPKASKLGAFVAGIARHVIADMRRAQHRAAPLEALPVDAQAQGDPDCLTELISSAERQAVRRALSGLTAGDRELLHLCFFDGLSPSEVAARLHEPAPRIRKRKSRALERLRAAFFATAQQRHDAETKPTREVDAPRERKPQVGGSS